jgi:hypothetical protein
VEWQGRVNARAPFTQDNNFVENFSAGIWIFAPEKNEALPPEICDFGDSFAIGPSCGEPVHQKKSLRVPEIGCDPVAARR